MNIIEAIEKANAFVFENTGVKGYPEFVRAVESPGKQRCWQLVYSAKLFFLSHALAAYYITTNTRQP
jgi:hypothetical protein